LAVGLLALTLSCSSALAQSDSVEQFYKGSQVKLIASAGPGSGYTIWVHFIGQYLGKFIPGNPNIVVTQMAGAGGLIAANYLYSVAPKDGREIAALAREAPALAILGAKGVSYDAEALNWLGSPTSESNICVVSSKSPVQTIDDLFKHETIVGSDGVGSGMHIFPTALNAILSTKFKSITAYSDSGVVLLALDRGELAGVCQSADTLMRARGDAIRSGALRVILQGGLKPNPKFPGVPFVLDLAKTEPERQALRFLYAGQALGRPYAVPPGVPKERVAALRKAFMDMFSDKDFIADATKQGYELNPISGDDMAALIKDLAATPKPVIDQVSRIMNPK
jgi:tripartite-type tricarboxylate transporter receptor subunit TctC